MVWFLANADLRPGRSPELYRVAERRPRRRDSSANLNCCGDPNGIRTRVTAVKGRCPRPLDDRVSERQISRRRQGLQAAFVAVNATGSKKFFR
jgi:hypothetical protein